MVIRSKSRIDEHDYQRITISAFQTFWNVCIKELENYSKFNSWCDKCTIECQNIGKKTTLMWNFLLIQSSDWCCKTQLFLWQLIMKVVCYLLSDLWSNSLPLYLWLGNLTIFCSITVGHWHGDCLNTDISAGSSQKSQLLLTSTGVLLLKSGGFLGNN